MMTRTAEIERIAGSLVLAAALVAAALSGWGCASPGAASAHGPGGPPGMAKGMSMEDCPMHDPGAKVAVEDVEGGVALRFTTSGDVAKLREHVAHMAEQHEHEGMMDAHAVAEDVEGGARLVLTPHDPAQLAQLREHVHGHAERMSHGECPMMRMHGDHAMGPGQPPPEGHEHHEEHEEHAPTPK